MAAERESLDTSRPLFGWLSVKMETAGSFHNFPPLFGERFSTGLDAA